MVALENKPKTKYKNVSIPEEMKKEIERIIINDERLGFASVQEFVKEAIRGSIVLYGGTKRER